MINNRGGIINIGVTDFTTVTSLIAPPPAYPEFNVAEIVLHGNRNELYYAQAFEIEAGGKAFVNSGFLRLSGKNRSHRITRLLESVIAVDNVNTLTVSKTETKDWM